MGLQGESRKEIWGLVGRSGNPTDQVGRLQVVTWQEMVREKLVVAQSNGVPKVLERGPEGGL